MLDFTSALYLGLQHPSSSLPAWSRLSLGKPAALEELPQTSEVERGFAELVGCDRALAGASTLHLFWDLFGWFARPGIRIFVDGATYPIGRWGLARAALAGVPVHYFPEHDVEALRMALDGNNGARPVILADGFCPACDHAAPLREYVELAASQDGWVVVDDSQALGLFGRRGGGSLRKFGLTESSAILVSSLAKALGVPMAMLAGRALDVEQIREHSDIRIHCSPPSVPILNAAAHALTLNAEMGDCLRARLAGRVARFRNGLKQLGLKGNCSLFPMQRLHLPGEWSAEGIYERLLQRQVRCVLHSGRNNRGAQISFIVTARHSLEDINEAIYALASAIGGTYAVAQERPGWTSTPWSTDTQNGPNASEGAYPKRRCQGAKPVGLDAQTTPPLALDAARRRSRVGA